MRSKRNKASQYTVNRYILFAALGLLLAAAITINCSLAEPAFLEDAVLPIQDNPQLAGTNNNAFNASLDASDGDSAVLSDQLWADVSESIKAPRPAHSSSSTISLDIRDANLLDVLSLLAYKLDVNIIYLEEPRTITIKTRNLSPITTFQLILQKEGLDYLTVGKNYIVGQQSRLYSDFATRMLLTKFNLFYVSASAMEGYLSDLGVSVQSLTVDSNQHSIWMQGTPMALCKARELINALDIMDNAAFAEGGARKIRMPVAIATGSRAEEELEALIDLLSILLDGFRDGRTDMGWVTWDHPDPIPYIYMDWENPIIKPYDIMMKITRDFAADYDNQVRYLIAEGSPANIELVNQMISAISSTPSSPFTFTRDNRESSENVQYVPPPTVEPEYFTVSIAPNPPLGGTTTGSGSYIQGTSVTITAAPAEGFQFERWLEGGLLVSESSSYTFTINSNRNFTAVFSIIEEEEEEEE
ncbi:MAG: hypothetical protein SCJ97_10120 [Bacillota bacterium]|nr:hypothetical protein [Bacillota bacterium]